MNPPGFGRLNHVQRQELVRHRTGKLDFDEQVHSSTTLVENDKSEGLALGRGFSAQFKHGFVARKLIGDHL